MFKLKRHFSLCIYGIVENRVQVAEVSFILSSQQNFFYRPLLRLSNPVDSCIFFLRKLAQDSTTLPHMFACLTDFFCGCIISVYKKGRPLVAVFLIFVLPLYIYIAKILQTYLECTDYCFNLVGLRMVVMI